MKIKEYPLSFFYSLRLRLTKLRLKEDQIPVVVSLTSIPSRLATLDIVINSLLEQSKQPKKIVLWLNYSLENKLPKRLESLQNNTFSIKYCSGTSSFRKLLPTLSSYKDSIIVTCDDDMIYPRDWLSCLYQGHRDHPDCIISQVGRLIERNANNNLMPYSKWKFIRSEYIATNLLPIGYGGVLYPRDAFDKQVFNEEVFMALCPKADDLWFKAMAYLNGKQAYCISEKARPIPIINTQKTSLNSSNIKEDRNRVQWQALCEKYPALSDF